MGFEPYNADIDKERFFGHQHQHHAAPPLVLITSKGLVLPAQPSDLSHNMLILSSMVFTFQTV